MSLIRLHRRCAFGALAVAGWVVCGAYAEAQVTVTIDWNAVQGASDARLFGINVWDATDPTVAAQPGYSDNLAAISPGVVRFHAAEMVQPGNAKAWVDSSFEWQATTIDSVLGDLSPSMSEAMLNVPRWPAAWNASGSSRLDPNRYGDYANYVATLVDIANNQLGYGVDWLEPFNEIDQFYDGDAAEMAVIHNTVVAAVRAVDPDIKIAAGAWIQPFDTTDIQQFMSAVGAANMDAFTYHHYATSGTTTDRETLYDRASVGSSSVAGRGSVVRGWLDAIPGGSSIELWLSETNIYSNFANDTTGLMAGGVGAVWDALMHTSMIRRGDIDVVQPWNDSDGTYGKITPNGSGLRPAGHVRSLMAEYAVGDWVSGDSDDTAAVETLAVVGDDTYLAMLINRSGAAVDASLSGFSTGMFADQFDIYTVSDSGLATTGGSIAANPDLDFTLSPDSIQFVVFSPAGLQGDYNGDGVVDAADYTEWRDTSSTLVAVGEGADGNSNGRIDGPDYGIWASHYGSGSAPSFAVPEPTGVEFALFLAGLAARRRRFALGATLFPRRIGGVHGG